MDDNAIVDWTFRDARRIDRCVTDFEHRPIGTRQPTQAIRPGGGIWYYGKTTSAVTAGTLSSPTTFTFNIWLPDYTSMADPRPFVVSTESAQLGVTGVNRSSGTLSSGKMLKVEHQWGEWSIKWGDC